LVTKLANTFPLIITPNQLFLSYYSYKCVMMFDLTAKL